MSKIQKTKINEDLTIYTRSDVISGTWYVRINKQPTWRSKYSCSLGTSDKEKAIIKNIFRVNVESTARLLEYAYESGAKHFVYASSGGIYGCGNQAFKENAPVVDSGKLGYYLASKYSSELLAQQYSSLMQVSILRFFFIYGGRQRKSMLLPRLVESIRSKKTINL